MKMKIYRLPKNRPIDGGKMAICNGGFVLTFGEWDDDQDDGKMSRGIFSQWFFVRKLDTS